MTTTYHFGAYLISHHHAARLGLVPTDDGGWVAVSDACRDVTEQIAGHTLDRAGHERRESWGRYLGISQRCYLALLPTDDAFYDRYRSWPASIDALTAAVARNNARPEHRPDAADDLCGWISRHLVARAETTDEIVSAIGVLP